MSKEHPHPLFTLPKDPVDQHTVRWWRVNTYVDVPRIEEIVATYHVNTPWKALYPDDTRGGSPFENEWRVVSSSGGLGARGGAWLKLRDYPVRDCYATEVEAAKAALQRLFTNCATLERRLAEMRAGAVEIARKAFPDGGSPFEEKAP